jgi:hypothetical protein
VKETFPPPCSSCWVFFIVVFQVFLWEFFFFLMINDYNKKFEIQIQEGLGNLKYKLGMKVRGDNASEDAGPLV